MDTSHVNEVPKVPRCEERRRPVLRYKVPATTLRGETHVSNHPFTGMLIAATAKGLLPALRRSTRSKYFPHVGTKQRMKALSA